MSPEELWTQVVKDRPEGTKVLIEETAEGYLAEMHRKVRMALMPGCDGSRIQTINGGNAEDVLRKYVIIRDAFSAVEKPGEEA